MTFTDSSDNAHARIRNIPFAYPMGAGFGNHYVTQDKSLRTAGQFIVAVYPCGDSRRSPGDVFLDTPHIVIRTWDGTEWRDASVTPIAGHGNRDFYDNPANQGDAVTEPCHTPPF
ncbi:MAG TPA: hypothetical protein VGG75_13580 [Trebonia sp.]|jgi:hypothetical protein